MSGKTKRKSISRTVERVIYEKYKGKCAICGRPTPFDEGTIDHKKPISKGGTYDPSNLQWLCHKCNALKGNNRTNAEVKKLLKGKK